jgi:hypothetical protein
MPNATLTILNLIAAMMTTHSLAMQNKPLIGDAIVATVLSQAAHLDVVETGIAITTVTITKIVIMAAVIAVKDKMPMQWSPPQGSDPGIVCVHLHASAPLLKIRDLMDPHMIPHETLRKERLWVTTCIWSHISTTITTWRITSKHFQAAKNFLSTVKTQNYIATG